MKNLRLQERKQELKELALKIRSNKSCQWKKYQFSQEFRLKHIAYCMARGRDYEQIEHKTHEHKKIHSFTWEKINTDIGYLKEGFNEDVHIGS